MYLRHLEEDDQYARVQHLSETFTLQPSSFWDPDHNKEVEYREFHVKQHYVSVGTDHEKVRINGFRIVTPNLLTTNNSGNPLYAVRGPCKVDETSGLITVLPSTKRNDSGIIATIYIDKQYKTLEVIKLGFDSDYNPVCFLANDNGREEKGVGALDRQGKLNMGLDSQEAQYTAEERSQWPSIYQRHPRDHFAWNVVRNRLPVAFTQHRGLWALRGDRRNGLDVKIPDMVDLVIARGEWDGQLVWEVHLNNLKSSTTGRTVDLLGKGGDKMKGLFGKR